MTTLKRLARTQAAPYTVKLLREQGGVCPLCLSPIRQDERGGKVLDHNHDTGEVRGVLCRWCNAQLGKVENAAIRAKKRLSYVHWLENALAYINQPGKGILYHLHKTDAEKADAKRLRERKRYAAKKAREQL